jgi:hypothetical protein
MNIDSILPQPHKEEYRPQRDVGNLLSAYIFD